jgi:hypothetical protein
MNMNTTVTGNRWFRFTQAPLILRAYVLFLLVDAALFFSEFYPPVSAATVRYHGPWSSPSLYLFTLFFALGAILTPQRKLIYAVAALLGLIVLLGTFDTIQHIWGTEAERPDFGNPYLFYHPYRPIFTVALPASWLLLFMSPIMRKWIKNSSTCSDAGEREIKGDTAPTTILQKRRP